VGVSSVNQVVMRFNVDPVSATITGQTRTGLGAAAATGGSGTFSNSKFDIRQTGRFHRFAIAMTGNVEVSGLDAKAVKAGKR